MDAGHETCPGYSLLTAQSADREIQHIVVALLILNIVRRDMMKEESNAFLQSQLKYDVLQRLDPECCMDLRRPFSTALMAA